MQTDFNKRIKQDWSPNNQKRYTWIYNKSKEGMQDFDYDIKDYILKINKPKLLNFIKKLDIGDGSKEAMFFTVSKYLQHNDKNSPHIYKFQVEGHKLMNKAKQQDGEHEIDSDKVEAYHMIFFLKIIKDTDYKTNI